MAWKVFVAVGLSTLLSACGLQVFTEPTSNPLIEEKLASLDLVATTASRRMAYVRREKVENEPSAADNAAIADVRRALLAVGDEHGDSSQEPNPNVAHVGRYGGKIGEFCAEPSPDAVENVAAAFGAALEAAREEADGSKASISGQFSRQLATAVAAMFRRTQGIQFYRDGAFFLCQAMMNGYMDAYEYRLALKFLRDKSYNLILAEVQSDAWKTAGESAKPDVISVPKPLPSPPDVD